MSRANLAYSLVATAPSPAGSGTSLVVTAGQGSYFVSNSWATVWPTSEVPTPANAEIVFITNVTSDTLTITRAQQGTSARTIVVGDQIANTITVDDFSVIEGAISAVSNSLSAETVARISADNVISDRVSVVSSALSDETSARVAKDNALSDAISVVSQALSIAFVSIAVVSNAVSAEASARVSADNQLSNTISVETAARIAADNSLSDRLSILSAKLSTEISAISQSHSALSQAVSVADAALSVRVNTVSDAQSVTNAKLLSLMSLLDAGTTGQVLKKQSNTDFDFAWDTDLTAGGGGASATVTSANISALSNRISILSATLSTQISAISQAHSALSQAVSVADAALSVRIDTQSNAISVLSAALSTQISAISQAHSALSQAVSVLSADHLSLKDRVSANSSLISTVASALSQQISALSVQLSLQVSALSQVHSALSVKVDTISQQVSILSATGNLIGGFQNVDTSAVSAGAPVYAFTSALTFKRANASAVATKPVLGLVADTNIAVSATGRVQTGGLLTLTTGQWDNVTGQTGGLTAGSIYYLDVTAGLLTTTAPTTGAVRPVGVALSSTVMQLTLAMVDDYASALSTLSTAISALSAQLSLQISAISQAHSALSQAVSVLSADHLSLKDRVSANSSLISTVASALSQQISALSVQLSLQVSALSQVHSALSADVVSVKDRVSGISAAVSSLSADLTSVKNTVSANSSLISTVASALSQQISALSVQLSLQVSALSQVVSAMSVRVDGVSDRLSALTSAHNALSNAVSALSVGPGATDQYISLQNQDSVTVSAGAPVYLHTVVSGFGSFKLADASAISAPRRPIGLVVTGSVAVSAVGTIRTRDSLSLTTAQWDSITGDTGGLSAGAAYYLGTTRGRLTQTMPTGANAAVIIGYGVTTTELRMVPFGGVADWLSDSISVGTATAADLSNKISALSAALSTQISAISQVHSALSANVATISLNVSALSTAISALSATLSTTASALSNNISILSTQLSLQVSALSQVISVISAGLGGVQMKVAAGNQSISGTGLAKISGLSVSLAANGIYQLDGWIMASQSAPNAIGMGLSLSGATMKDATWRFFGNLSVVSTGTGLSGLSTTVAGVGWGNESAFGVATYSAAVTGTGNLMTEFRGLFAMSTAGGSMQFKAKAGATGCITFKGGSFIRAYKIG